MVMAVVVGEIQPKGCAMARSTFSSFVMRMMTRPPRFQ
jgi:hypothetical protein